MNDHISWDVHVPIFGMVADDPYPYDSINIDAIELRVVGDKTWISLMYMPHSTSALGIPNVRKHPNPGESWNSHGYDKQ